MAKITFEDKEFLNKNENIADKNKVNDTDLNEIKEVVNQNANDIGDVSNLITNEKNIVPAVNEIAGTSGVVIYEKTLDTDSSSIIIDGLDLDNDKHYAIEFRGSGNATGEVRVQLNSISGQYNHIAVAANGTTANDSNNNFANVWRYKASMIAYSMTIDNSRTECLLKMDLYKASSDEKSVRYNIDYSYPHSYSHSISFIRGQLDLDYSVSNITSITFKMSVGTFRAGSKVIVRKVK